jgi:predicted small lipoprotein YifL
MKHLILTLSVVVALITLSGCSQKPASVTVNMTTITKGENQNEDATPIATTNQMMTMKVKNLATGTIMMVRLEQQDNIYSEGDIFILGQTLDACGKAYMPYPYNGTVAFEQTGAGQYFQTVSNGTETTKCTKCKVLWNGFGEFPDNKSVTSVMPTIIPVAPSKPATQIYVNGPNYGNIIVNGGEIHYSAIPMQFQQDSAASDTIKKDSTVYM